jgi:hypothetical protein
VGSGAGGVFTILDADVTTESDITCAWQALVGADDQINDGWSAGLAYRLRTPDPWNCAELFLLPPRTEAALKVSELRGQTGESGSGKFLAYQGITLMGLKF